MENNKHIFVFAKITPREEFINAAQNELIGMLEATRSEPGCIQFELHGSECGQYIYLYEEWMDKSSLENHHQEAHTKIVAAKFEGWLAEPTEVILMNKLQ